MNYDLFGDDTLVVPQRLALSSDAWVLRGLALPYVPTLMTALAAIELGAPFRNMQTAGGYRMSVAMTNCGEWGWVSDRQGYRYTRQDPDSGRDWPAMPPAFLELAKTAAGEAGFADFRPDACLINRYEVGTRLSLHQDRDERRLDAPIVSVSLGIAAIFLWGGAERSERTLRVPLQHGDVVVWGGEDRLRFHGVAPLKAARSELLGERRLNLTFRRAG